jgi:hypothetical protein
MAGTAANGCLTNVAADERQCYEHLLPPVLIIAE